MKIGIFGSGQVGRTLAQGLSKHGHEVMIGSRDLEKLGDWGRQNPDVKLGSLKDTASFGEMTVLAVKGSAAIDTLRLADPVNLSGKVIIDATNPLTDAPPVSGVLSFFTTLDQSLMESLQKEFPQLRFVKAFNSVGSNLMIDPQFGGTKPTMFICGNDEPAKQVVTKILDQVGWEAADMGSMEAARAIEPLCILWCIPGFRTNQWNHAFKLLK